jgi:hypothetical protein
MAVMIPQTPYFRCGSWIPFAHWANTMIRILSKGLEKQEIYVRSARYCSPTWAAFWACGGPGGAMHCAGAA